MAMATTPGGGNPLEVFPKEVWEIILEHLGRDGSPRDILNTSLACTEFQKILKEKTKVKWMFGSVLPFIFRFPYLKKTELLACRRVCKNWQRGVDNFLDDSEYHYFRGRWFEEESEIQEFLKAMGQQKMETPLALRSLDFSERRNGMNSGLWEKALVLLSLYGDQTWFLSVSLSLYDPQRFYEILRQALEFTPNLKCLYVDGLYEFFESNEEDHSVRLQKLEEHLENHPLPKIDSLKTLRVGPDGYFPFVMYEKLISDINPEHLKCLKIVYNYNSEVAVAENMIPIRKPLLSLTKLDVSCGRSLEKLEHIFDGISPTAPLEYLELDFYNLVGIDCARMCKAINKFKWTLKTLVITIGGWVGDDYTPDMGLRPALSLSELDTPNLKSLTVYDMVVEPGSFPPSLEKLYLYFYWKLSLDQPQRDFYKSMHDAGGLENLPIWGEMRNLKVMKVEFNFWEDERMFEHDFFCTRKMHEDAVKNRGQL